MACIYRYIDKNDNIIKYVGIVYGKKTNLKNRILQHKYKDPWVKTSVWIIEYLDEKIDSRIDAELLEAYYISLFETYKYYNKSKSNWGKSKLLYGRKDKWVLYLEETSDQFDEYAKKICDCETNEERLSLLKKIKNNYISESYKSKESFSIKLGKALSRYLIGFDSNYIYISEYTGGICFHTNVGRLENYNPFQRKIDYFWHPEGGVTKITFQSININDLQSYINTSADKAIEIINKKREELLEFAIIIANMKQHERRCTENL